VLAIDGGSAVDDARSVRCWWNIQEIALKAVESAWPQNLRLLQPYMAERIVVEPGHCDRLVQRGCRTSCVRSHGGRRRIVGVGNCLQHSWRCEFNQVGSDLKGNIAFMMRAVDLDGYSAVRGANDQDDLLCVRAVASHRLVGANIRSTNKRSPNTLRTVSCRRL
jgi:hypothetical protein